jgi:hypothetical protein
MSRCTLTNFFQIFNFFIVDLKYIFSNRCIYTYESKQHAPLMMHTWVERKNRFYMIEGIIFLLSTKVLYDHIRIVGGKYFSIIDNELSKHIYSHRFEINHQHKHTEWYCWEMSNIKKQWRPLQRTDILLVICKDCSRRLACR